MPSWLRSRIDVFFYQYSRIKATFQKKPEDCCAERRVHEYNGGEVEAIPKLWNEKPENTREIQSLGKEMFQIFSK
jgi:hypothetical protein